MNLQDIAIRTALDWGLWVFPVAPRSKIPATAHGVLDATRDYGQIVKWWRETPDANVGIACGPSGLLVVDVDGPDVQLPGELTPTFSVGTPRGAHHYYRGRAKSWKGQGFDVKGMGGYVLGPGSVHPSGSIYGIRRILHIADAPQWVIRPNRPQRIWSEVGPIRHPSRYIQAVLQREVQRVREARQGSRNHELNRAAFSLGRLVEAGLSKADIEAHLTQAAIQAGLDADEIRKTLISGLQAGCSLPREIPA